MKRKFAVLTVLGALLALAIPASSMAAMYPAGHKFEIVGDVKGPTLTTALGSCTIAKITGQIPAAPMNETERAPASVTAGTCTSGTSLTLSSTWLFGTLVDSHLPGLSPTGPEGIVLRFSSLPGCKLGNASQQLLLLGVWSNGVTTPKLLKSGYHAHAEGSLTWANDGGTCALAGQKESLGYEDEYGTVPARFPVINTVNNLTSPTTPIIVGPKK
jgi:hypothetical protein